MQNTKENQAIISNLIDELIDSVVDENTHDNCVQLKIDKLKQAIFSGGWVDIKERLPDIPDVYLTYQPNIVCFQHKKEKLCLTTFHPDTGWGSCSRVTHWQPLPQPPKETKRG